LEIKEQEHEFSCKHHLVRRTHNNISFTVKFFHSKFASGKLILSVQNVVAVHARTLSFTR